MADTTPAPRGLIFNIQKFSVNDGPGIRTAVFLKGCPLRCKWCANPESQSRHIETSWDDTKQTQSTEGEWKTVDEVFDICIQDLPFYEESGGGVTLSGGEVLFAPDFAVALMEKLKTEHIHIALETTGYAAPEVFDRVTALADLLLFDVKHWDEQRHIAGTGVSNQPILANLKRAIANGTEVLPRIPVIPDFNDSLDDATGLAALLHKAGATRAQLLPFHQFGENKYNRLHKTYEYAGVPAYHPEDLEDYRNIFIENNIEAFF